MCLRGWGSWVVRKPLRALPCCSWLSGMDSTLGTSCASSWNSSSSTSNDPWVLEALFTLSDCKSETFRWDQREKSLSLKCKWTLNCLQFESLVAKNRTVDALRRQTYLAPLVWLACRVYSQFALSYALVGFCLHSYARWGSVSTVTSHCAGDQ